MNYKFRLGYNVVFIFVGHAGHEELPDQNSNKLDSQEHIFNLEGQIKHKLDFIKSIDGKNKLHLIGHSIGCWIILELLDKHPDIVQRTKSINLLFPTVQKMALSPSGKFLNKVIRPIHSLVILFITVIYFLPDVIKDLLVNIYLKLKSLPVHHKEGILKISNRYVGEKMLFMAYDEMDKVTLLNVTALDKIKHKTNVIYSTNDGWAPIHYMEDFKQFEPSLRIKEVPYDHAFVLKSSGPVARIVAEYISTKQLN